MACPTLSYPELETQIVFCKKETLKFQDLEDSRTYLDWETASELVDSI